MRILIWALCLSLAGCGMAQQARVQQESSAATSIRDQQSAACESQFPDRRSKPATPRISCLNQAELTYHQAMARSVGNPYLDLIHLSHAQRLQVAQRYDKGEIDPAQYEVELAQIAADANNQISARMNNATIAASAQQQAAAASQQAAIARQQAITSAIQSAAPPRPVSCTRFGNTVTCN